MIRMERRLEPDRLWSGASTVFALLAAFIVSTVLLTSVGADAVSAFTMLWNGAFGSVSALINTCVKATPLILTGLATAVAFRAGLGNIGQEGQVFAGAMASYLATLVFTGLPTYVFIPIVILSGVLGGALMGVLAAGLKVRFGVNELISTVMLNYLIINLLSYFLSSGLWTEVGVGVSYQQTPIIPMQDRLQPLVSGTRLHMGVLIPLIAVMACSILLRHTALGYEIRAFGQNPVAAAHKGINVSRTTIVVMAISGGLAALAGSTELLGVSDRLRAANFFGLGYTGIAVGMIGGLAPWGVLLAGLAFGALAAGGPMMRVVSDVPAALIPTMQAIFLLFFLCAGVLAKYRIVRSTRA